MDMNMSKYKIHMNKITVNRFIKTVSFLLIVFLLLSTASNILQPKNNKQEESIHYYKARGFYGEPKNSLDIIAIGNSNIGAGLSPLDLWKRWGYTSYTCAKTFQNVCEAYKMLEEVLTCQTPKLVILEVDGTYQGGAVTGLDETMGAEIEDLFPVMEYHNRWKSLSKINIFQKPQFTWRNEEKGFILSKNTKGYTGKENMVETNKISKIQPYVLFYLNKFISLCKSNHCQILFVEMPSIFSWNYSRHNAVATYAKKNNIPFLDFNINRQDTNFDWETDTMDAGSHLKL